MKVMKTAGIGLVLASLFLAAPLVAEEKPAEAAEKPAEAEKPKKRPPRKENEYRDWSKAQAAAEAWEQPILAFVDLAGEKRSAQMKLKLLSKQEFYKDVIQPNCLYYHITVPKQKVKRNNRNRNNQVKEDPKPDWDAMSKQDAELARKICNAGGKGNANPPVLALLTPQGRPITVVPVGTEGAVVGDFVDAPKTSMEMKKFNFTISPRLQKLIDKEKKAIADLEKRHK